MVLKTDHVVICPKIKKESSQEMPKFLGTQQWFWSLVFESRITCFWHRPGWTEHVWTIFMIHSKKYNLKFCHLYKTKYPCGINLDSDNVISWVLTGNLVSEHTSVPQSFQYDESKFSHLNHSIIWWKKTPWQSKSTKNWNFGTVEFRKF